MPWFKVDDALHHHPKTRRAGVAAIGLWTLSGSLSMAYKLDGFVPAWYVHSLKAQRQAAQLVACGLWVPGHHEVEGDGWWFHDWGDYQPSSDEIEKTRANARQRQRSRRQRLTQPPEEASHDE